MAGESRSFSVKIEELASGRGLASSDRPLNLKKFRTLDDDYRRIAPSFDAFPDRLKMDSAQAMSLCVRQRARDKSLRHLEGFGGGTQRRGLFSSERRPNNRDLLR